MPILDFTKHFKVTYPPSGYDPATNQLNGQVITKQNQDGAEAYCDSPTTQWATLLALPTFLANPEIKSQSWSNIRNQFFGWNNNRSFVQKWVAVLLFTSFNTLTWLPRLAINVLRLFIALLPLLFAEAASKSADYTIDTLKTMQDWWYDSKSKVIKRLISPFFFLATIVFRLIPIVFYVIAIAATAVGLIGHIFSAPIDSLRVAWAEKDPVSRVLGTASFLFIIALTYGVIGMFAAPLLLAAAPAMIAAAPVWIVPALQTIGLIASAVTQLILTSGLLPFIGMAATLNSAVLVLTATLAVSFTIVGSLITGPYNRLVIRLCCESSEPNEPKPGESAEQLSEQAQQKQDQLVGHEATARAIDEAQTSAAVPETKAEPVSATEKEIEDLKRTLIKAEARVKRLVKEVETPVFDNQLRFALLEAMQAREELFAARVRHANDIARFTQEASAKVKTAKINHASIEGVCAELQASVDKSQSCNSRTMERLGYLQTASSTIPDDPSARFVFGRDWTQAVVATRIFDVEVANTDVENIKALAKALSAIDHCVKDTDFTSVATDVIKLAQARLEQVEKMKKEARQRFGRMVSILELIDIEAKEAEAKARAAENPDMKASYEAAKEKTNDARKTFNFIPPLAEESLAPRGATPKEAILVAISNIIERLKTESPVSVAVPLPAPKPVSWGTRMWSNLFRSPQASNPSTVVSAAVSAQLTDGPSVK